MILNLGNDWAGMVSIACRETGPSPYPEGKTYVCGVWYTPEELAVENARIAKLVPRYRNLNTDRAWGVDDRKWIGP